MAKKKLSNAGIAMFCESIAVTYAAGIQIEESLSMLAEGDGTSRFKRCCRDMYGRVIDGKTLATAMRENGSFPDYAVNMVSIGERSGHLEGVLWGLGRYYDETARLFTKIKHAVAYPAALMCVMSVILLFTVAVILPVFMDVYKSFAGDLASSSYSYVSISLIIGDVALGVTLLLTLVALVALVMSNSSDGQKALVAILSRMPFSKGPFRQLAVSRFATALSTAMKAGLDPETSLEYALGTVEDKRLRRRLAKVRSDVVDPMQGKSLSRALSDSGIFGPVYSRMLLVGSRAGSTEAVLSSLSQSFFDESVTRIDRLVDNTEPALAAFLTISVGCTLVAVMIPLVGIMGSIG